MNTELSPMTEGDQKSAIRKVESLNKKAKNFRNYNEQARGRFFAEWSRLEQFVQCRTDYVLFGSIESGFSLHPLRVDGRTCEVCGTTTNNCPNIPQCGFGN